MKGTWRRFSGLILILSSIFILTVLLANIWVVRSTSDRIFSSPDSLPKHRTAIVLGTSSRLTNGKPNPFFQNRMEKAAQLYRAGKVGQFILSGDNRTRFYDEPGTMRKVLVEKGVPAGLIRLDAEGLRTLNSLERCKNVFGQDTVIIITQPFHAYRALFLAEHLGMKAVVFAAPEPGESVGFRVYLRELFARARAVADVAAIRMADEDEPGD